MDATATQIDAAATSPSHDESTKKQIRGSSLLLAGRVVAMVVNFSVQVLTVRYLSKSDYGAFAYALAVVSLGSSITVFGLDKTITRFVPIYQEHREYNKVFGSMLMMAGTIVLLGIALVSLFYGLQGIISQSVVSDEKALALLLIMIALAPVQALDELLLGMFTVFASPKLIFVRKHILGPVLKLSVVLLLIMLHSNVYFLATGYLAAGALGVAIYSIILVRILREQQLLDHFSLRSIQMPFREIFGFSIPLLTTDVVFLLRSTLVIVFLEFFRSTTDVAAFRAVYPVARLNIVALQSFTFLFTPMAARMFARNDQDGINNLYWETAVWMAIISFPIFAVSFSLAKPVTVLLFGARYADSGIILAVLALGYYFHAALGFNSHTLKVVGKVKYIVTIDILAAIIGLGINLLLIPRYGAIGAGVGTAGTLIVHNILNHAGLLLGTGVELFQWRYLRVYVVILVSISALWLIQTVATPPLYTGLALAALASVLVVRLNRNVLNVHEMFPELLRFRLVRTFLGV